jgi:ribonuclease P protein component
VGIIVPRHKQTAVARNRVKRWLRETVRTALLPALTVLPPMDVVVRATPDAYAADLATLVADLAHAAKKLGATAR